MDNRPSSDAALTSGDIKEYGVVMLVGGMDPTGGAGLAADISTARLAQAYPMPVVSCVTSQNSKGFRTMQPVALDIFRDQLESVLSDVVPDAVKVGMLPSAAHMRVLAEMLCLYEHGPVVFDPIMAPTNGAENFSADWWEDRETLFLFFSQVSLITPNAVELHRLTEPLRNTTTFKEQFEASPILSEDASGEENYLFKLVTDLHLMRTFYGLDRILLTGGHNPGKYQYSDILIEPRPDLECPPELMKEVKAESEESPVAYTIGRIKGEFIDTPNTHGTGCVYSSAIACLLAKKVPVHIAVSMAKEILTFLLRAGKDWRLYEEGHGPAYSVISMPSSDFPGIPLNRDMTEFMN